MHYNYSDQATSLFYTYQIYLFSNIYFIITDHRRGKKWVKLGVYTRTYILCINKIFSFYLLVLIKFLIRWIIQLNYQIWIYIKDKCNENGMDIKSMYWSR